jgi:hypothetical protein
LEHQRETDIPELSEAELQVYGEFSDALVRRENPDVEEYLGRVPEASRPKLRQSLETAVWFQGVADRFKADHPGIRLFDLLLRRRRASRPGA